MRICMHILLKSYNYEQYTTFQSEYVIYLPNRFSANPQQRSILRLLGISQLGLDKT